MVVIELVAGPTEELHGGAGEAIGEFERVFDVFWRNPNGGVVQDLFDGRGRGVGY